jgi:hypothetical protein
VFATGTVPDGLHRVHLLDAFLITSAAIPTYLLALRVTRNVWASTFAAALRVAVPWTVLSSFLLRPSRPLHSAGRCWLSISRSRLRRDDTMRVEGASAIYGDPTTDRSISLPRQGGVQLSRIYLSGQIGADC